MGVLHGMITRSTTGLLTLKQLTVGVRAESGIPGVHYGQPLYHRPVGLAVNATAFLAAVRQERHSDIGTNEQGLAVRVTSDSPL